MNTYAEYLWLIGLTTKEQLYLGFGFRSWPLLSFQGPILSEARIDPTVTNGKHYLVLPRHLLVKLYERFEKANPDGCVLANEYEIDDILFSLDVAEDERNRLWDAGEVGWQVFDAGMPPHGRDPIRHYLPELFEPGVLRAIVEDPCLDMSNEPPNALSLDERDKDMTQHYRWADWWLKR